MGRLGRRMKAFDNGEQLQTARLYFERREWQESSLGLTRHAIY